MTIRSLINTDGQPFDGEELNTLKGALDALADKEREDFRNANAREIAEDNSPSTLIVSGPGTGKSFIFLRKIEQWLRKDPAAEIRVVSFVRKLVADLQGDVNSDQGLSNEQKGQINVSTLHKLARSVVEKSHGTKERPFDPHLRVIVDMWEKEVWTDAQELCGVTGGYPWEEMREGLFNAEIPPDEKWPELVGAFNTILAYYNAVCFADIVLLATVALQENPDLVEEKYFILDEYQDFNQAEENLVNELTKGARGVLMVGDDDQVLYEKLKSGKAELIRRHYASTEKTNAMLPFCGRCSFHITRTASAFIGANPDADCISKVYLPLKTSTEADIAVQCVASATPSGAVNYIRKFVEENEEAIQERKGQLERGEKKDAFLLILTPDKKLAFYGNNKDELLGLAARYQSDDGLKYGEDYYKTLTYFALANDQTNNYAFRKVLSYERVSRADITRLIKTGLDGEVNFAEIDEAKVKGILGKASKIQGILNAGESTPEQKAQEISEITTVNDIQKLTADISQSANEDGFAVKHEDEEAAELEEIAPSKADAVGLMSVVGSKGLSADHVIIVGFDDVNMRHVPKNAFYVAMTRARKTLHLITTLQARGSTGPHSFFEALPDEHIQFAIHKRTSGETTFKRNRAEFLGYLQSITRKRNRPR